MAQRRSDSHYYLPDITKNHSDYQYMPYHGLIKNNPSPYIMVMVGHLMDASIDSKNAGEFIEGTY